MRCKDCEFWEPAVYTESFFGDCHNGNFIYLNNADNSLVLETLQKNYNDDILLYWDTENYSATFMTGANFGCIYFKRGKEEA